MKTYVLYVTNRDTKMIRNIFLVSNDETTDYEKVCEEHHKLLSLALTFMLEVWEDGDNVEEWIWDRNTRKFQQTWTTLKPAKYYLLTKNQIIPEFYPTDVFEYIPKDGVHTDRIVVTTHEGLIIAEFWYTATLKKWELTKTLDGSVTYMENK